MSFTSLPSLWPLIGFRWALCCTNSGRLNLLGKVSLESVSTMEPLEVNWRLLGMWKDRVTGLESKAKTQETALQMIQIVYWLQEVRKTGVEKESQGNLGASGCIHYPNCGAGLTDVNRNQDPSDFKYLQLSYIKIWFNKKVKPQKLLGSCFCHCSISSEQ